MRNNTSPLAIRYLPVSTLQPSPRNARTHTKHQIRQIADSILTFGFTNPILIDRDNRIAAGHGRVEAAKLLLIDSVPMIVLEELTQEQIRAYIITDNKLAENAGWDEAILAIELQHLISIENLGFDITVTGFEVPQIDLIIGNSTTVSDQPEEVAIPDSNEPALSRFGDIWELGFTGFSVEAVWRLRTFKC